MSPVPEPMQGGRRRPGEDGQEELHPPIGLFPGPPLSSSDEELEHNDTDAAFPQGYQPLPQEHEEDDDQEDGEIDYSSLSGLMAAVTTHGPNVVAEEAAGGEGISEQDRAAFEPVTPSDTSSHTSALILESATQRQEEQMQERAAVWSVSPAAQDRLALDNTKMEEIKSAMASVTLPQSAIPPWAHNLSDDAWKDQIACIISRYPSH